MHVVISNILVHIHIHATPTPTPIHSHPYTFMHTPLVSHACQQASSHKDAGNYSRARSFGRAALCFNIMAIVYFILLIIVIVVFTALVLSPA